MRSKLIFIPLIGLLLTGLDISQNSIGFSTAQSQEDNSQRKTKKTGSMTEKVAKKLGEAQELNGAIHFLCSDAAKFITGVVLPIDGGFSAFSGV